MEKMARIVDENREKTKESFRKLNEKVKQEIQQREDMVVLLVNYNEMLRNPQSSIQKIGDFIEIPSIDRQSMISVIDNRLYRQRR
jgi:nanoRNase/pAp phosphatase (c-di-AMP/oligoRNAs hydrolase)